MGRSRSCAMVLACRLGKTLMQLRDAFFRAVPLTGSGCALASDKTCLPGENFVVRSQKIAINDDMQNHAVPKTQVVQHCQEASQAVAPINGAPAQIPCMAACSTGAEGFCDKLFGASMSGHVYRQDAPALKDWAARRTVASGKTA